MSEPKRNISSMGTMATFAKGRACSDTLFNVLNRAFGHPMIEEERAAMPLAGGIMQHGYQCGMIWGSALAAGGQAYRLFGPGPQAETKAIMAARRIVDSFRTQNKYRDCFDITELNEKSSTMQMMKYFLLKGGTVGCFRMSGRYAPVALREINAALSDERIAVPAGPASCSAMLARQMGESELHSVMAAGLAGGIGLSGGACGALGAAIWISGMNSLKAGARKIAYKAPSAIDLIDKFLKSTNHEFACSKIVGREFESIDDHASYLCDGGCSKIIEVLAASQNAVEVQP